MATGSGLTWNASACGQLQLGLKAPKKLRSPVGPRCHEIGPQRDALLNAIQQLDQGEWKPSLVLLP